MLLSEGHPEAWNYPIGMVWVESELAKERLNRAEATRATLLKLAVSSLFSKEAGETFGDHIARLAGE